MTQGSKETGMANEHAMTDENPEMETQAMAEETVQTDPFAALEAENAELRDRLLRVAAEMENLRKRSQRDVADARSYAIANFARDMLGVADNLSRAIEALPEHARRSEDKGFIALIEGVEMTERDLVNVLARHGITRVDPKGERFDPTLHDAIQQVESAEHPPGTVLTEVVAGYRLGERLLRAAMVVVAKAPAPQPAAPASDEQADSE